MGLAADAHDARPLGCPVLQAWQLMLMMHGRWPFCRGGGGGAFFRGWPVLQAWRLMLMMRGRLAAPFYRPGSCFS